MFPSHHAASDGNALDGTQTLSRPSEHDSQDQLHGIGAPQTHLMADAKGDVSLHIFEGLGLYENHSESGRSSLHYGTMIGTPDTGQSSVSVRDDGDRQSTPKAASSLKIEVEMDHQSQLPTPLHDLEAPFLNTTDQVQHDQSSIGASAGGHLSPTYHTAAHDPTQTVSGDSHRYEAGLDSVGTRSTPVSRSQNHGSPGSRSSNRPDSLSTHTQASSSKADTEFRAKSSIPSTVTSVEFARQCFLAAYSSRLNPSALHPGEYRLLKDHLTLPQVSIYLNIRNAILRIWTRNPLVNVREDEAAGCARDGRYFSLALLARQWLVRHGYINFGCVDLPNTSGSIPRNKAKGSRRGTIVVVGAGMSGLGCARQLEGLIAQSAHRWTDRGERPPRVIVLEGRNRLGGRVYSHQLRDQPNLALPPGLRSTAEMGAQIVTGFEHGNPMNIIIRGQLGIHTYALKDNSILYDHDGSVVGKERDVRVEKLYNDILERASVFRNIAQPPRTVEVDRQLLAQGREHPDEMADTISQLEEEGRLDAEPSPHDLSKAQAPRQAAISTEKLTGRAYQVAGLTSHIPAAEAAKEMGWPLNSASTDASISLAPSAESEKPSTLGETMDSGISQYQHLISLSPQDLRLYNWHHANLEYANSANVNQLSLTGWDQDLGNEFEGEHTEVIGGYSQVPRGIWQYPHPLDVRFRKKVTSIKRSATGAQALLVCSDGESFEADHVVLTAPLGVLKAGSVEFSPPLPDWKAHAIQRLGYGLLNKVILVYERPFWEESRDMFGLLNDTDPAGSLNQRDYSSSRGRFYLFWNIIKTSGRPTLVALMAGDAAYQTERESNESLVAEATSRLKKMFPSQTVPAPSEAIVTRWLKDPFSCGSYSYVGPHTQSGDYDVMAQPWGNLHFAGEATCGTHPATVHGAYLSGLRAAAEVLDDLLGPVTVPQPLFPPRTKVEATPLPKAAKRKHHEYTSELYVPLLDQKPIIDIPGKVEAEAYEASIIGAILRQLGERPVKPAKQGVNPFLLFQKDYWYTCKAEADAAAQKKARKGDAKAGKQEIRLALGNKWRNAPEDVRRPYLDAAQASKDGIAALTTDFRERVGKWDEEAAKVREQFIAANPPPAGAERYLAGRTAIELGKARRERKERKEGGDADGHGDGGGKEVIAAEDEDARA